MAFQAKWAGWCRDCGREFAVGDYINRADYGGYRHAVCPAPRTGEMCDRCFMEKSLTGSCECD